MKLIEIEEYISNFNKGIHQGIGKWDAFRVRPTYLKFNDDSVSKWNELYRFLYNNPTFNIIKRTKSGGISKGGKSVLNNCISYDVLVTNSYARITVIIGDRTYIVNIGKESSSVEREVTPAQAWIIFQAKCKEAGINLHSYAIEDGIERKKEVPAPPIEMKSMFIDKTLHNVNHIDFHNSYPAGLCNTHPEFRTVIEPIYEARKDPKLKSLNKAILNYSIGCFHSKKRPWYAHWSHLAKDSITDNNNRIFELSKRLEENGCVIVGYNTDGIWYIGDVYHGDGEGEELGQWSNDHIDCQFRAKSNGVYEYIEDGVYYPVVRGTTEFDKMEPDRSKWKWGDIYNNPLFIYRFKEGEGIIRDEKI